MQRTLDGRGLLALFATLSLLALSACKGGAAPTPPGLGESLSTPTGTPYTMPAGITINNVVGATHPNNDASNIQCNGQAVASGNIYGSGVGNVDLCVQVLNGNGTTTNVTLPGGLIFLANNPPGAAPVQNGFVAQTQQIAVPAGTETIVVRAYCINKPFGPADGHDYQTNLLVTNYGPLQQIVSIIQGKQITTYQQAQVVQDAVWEVADGNGLSDSTKTKLENL